jgi:hypothetical protein
MFVSSAARRVLRHSHTRFCSTANRSMAGLTNHTSDDKFFSRKLELHNIEGFTKKGLLWEAAQADAAALTLSPEAYLHRVEKHMDTFFDEGKLFNRSHLLDELRSSLSHRGNFVLLLGGKDVGKTQVMKAFKMELSTTGMTYFFLSCFAHAFTTGFQELHCWSTLARLARA